MRSVDLNCDIGEGCANDEVLLELVSSANIACGFHAGDEATMHSTVSAAIKKGVAIGAHPGFPDRENFGRNEMDLPQDEIFAVVRSQVLALKEICETAGGQLNHVKPHGALYNMAARDADIARSVSEAVRSVDPELVLYGLSGSRLISEAERLGLKTASEVFADRTYTDDGRLTPRSEPDALIESVDQAVAQVVQMSQLGKVTSTSGRQVPLVAETICLHGDGSQAVEFARAIRNALTTNDIAILPVTK